MEEESREFEKKKRWWNERARQKTTRRTRGRESGDKPLPCIQTRDLSGP